MVNPSTHLENDQFGYACYTIVIPAPPDLTVELDEIERAAKQERAKIPAHITVKGTFYAIPDLDAMTDAVKEIARGHEPFDLSAAGMELWESDHSVIMGFPVNDQIQSLHDDLVSKISPMGKSAYKDDPYAVHMSIVNEVKPEGVELAKTMVEEVDFGEAVRVSQIDIMARDGVAWGGEWKRLERIGLGRS